jgi:membrane protein DedA with SNARE-associated domain
VRLRTPLLWLAIARAALSVVAIPLAPVLYREHFLILVLLRPTKEVLLAGGFLVRQGEVNLLSLLGAAVPLAIFGVWHFYGLGLGYAREIQTGKGLPSFAQRVLPTERIQKLCRLLERRGRRIVFVGRLASFPSALLGAAAGASDMPPRTFLPTDGAGGMLSIAEVIGAGYLFGESYHEAGPWITGAGVVLLFALLIGVGRALTRD